MSSNETYMTTTTEQEQALTILALEEEIARLNRVIEMLMMSNQQKAKRTSNVRRTDPKTSRMADKDNTPRRGTQRWKILKYLFDHGPSLADQWEAEFNWRSGPRAAELKRMELIIPTGNTGTTRFGSEGEILELTEAGRNVVLASTDHTV